MIIVRMCEKNVSYFFRVYMEFVYFICKILKTALISGINKDISDFCGNQVVVEGGIASEIENLCHFEVFGDDVSTTVVFIKSKKVKSFLDVFVGMLAERRLFLYGFF